MKGKGKKIGKRVGWILLCTLELVIPKLFYRKKTSPVLMGVSCDDV